MNQRKVRWVVGLLALLCGVLVGGPLVVWGQGDDVLPPQIYDTVPLSGEELALDGTVKFFFNQPMNPDAVAEAFSVMPAHGEGELSWDEQSTVLTYTPSDSYERATEYAFTVGTGAASAEGALLEEAYTLKLRTIGYLEVSEVLPGEDTTAVDTDSVVTVIFNRPVVPLVMVEDMGNLPQPLSFDPPVEGKGEWLNTSIYLFTPDSELRGGTEYTATVGAGLEDVTGGVLAEDFDWKFTTLRPDVLEITPRMDSGGIRLEQKVTVRFSQAMDPAAVEGGGFSLDRRFVQPDDEALGRDPVAGTFEWSDDLRTMTFTPDEMLELETSYSVVVDAEKSLSATGAPLVESAFSDFETLPYPRIVRTSPADGEFETSPYGGFAIYFNTLMDLESLEDKVIIEPEPWRDFDTYFSDWSFRYMLSFDTAPSTEYTITILPGMEDRYGNVIEEGLVVTYTTAAYPPELTIQATGRVGMYSSHNPTTRVFVTHRNVSRLDLALWNVSVSQLADFVGSESYDAWRNYSPASRDLLRQWTVDVSSQQDLRRYELMLVSDEGGSGISNIQCLGAPDPRVKVGDVAIITREDLRPLNVRQEPNLGATVVTQALPDETMQIIGGPFCEGGYLWWRVRLDNQLVGWAAEGDAENYYYEPLGAVPADPNAPESDAYGMPYQAESLDPGIYYLTVDSPETQEWDRTERRHVMLVASANVALKFSQDTALAWVNDLESGDPVAGVPVLFYNESFNPVGQAVTGDDGLAVIEIPHLSDLYSTMYATVDSDEWFGFTVSGWSDGMDPWQFDIRSDYDPENFTVYLYTDRPIYRPGQDVYFKGILRDRDDVTYTVPTDLKQVPVKIYDDRGEVIFDKVLDVSPNGSFSGELQLDDEAPLGYYRVVAEVSSNNRQSFGLSFNVAEYRTPEFQVDVTVAEDQVVQGDKIEVLVDSTYFFGGPVSNANVEYTVLSQDYYFRYTGPEAGYWSFTNENYDFYSPDYYGSTSGSVAEGAGTTDAQGRFLLELDADLGEKTRSQTFTVEARVIDESDQLVAGRTTVRVHQGLVYVGVQPVEYVGRAERENKVNLMAVDWYSEPVADQEITYEVVERRWFSVQEADDFGRTIWTWEVEEIPVEGASGTVLSDANGLAQISFVPPAGGVYKIYATTTDEVGNEVTSSTFTWVSGRNFINWRQDNNNRLQLITDKDEYNVGDVAEILIPSPWQGEAWALITVERGDILTHEVVKLETNSTVYELEMTPDFAPNVFVSVMLMKGVDEHNPTAAFKMGVVDLAVDTSQLVMDIEVTPSIDVEAGEFAGPGDMVEYTLTATDWEGNPVEGAEVGVGLTDLAVLSIADSNSSELLPFFYSERGITVRTANPLTVSVDQATQVIIDTIKGGGGGYGSGGLFEVRQEFVDTPLWEPSVVTDENGQATVVVTMPDNLTTWRLDARAVTSGADGPMLVGQTTFDLLSTKPVLLRPGTPRFFVVGDNATMSAIVNNNSNEDLLTAVTLEGTGFVLNEGVENTQWVNIPAKGRARVNWVFEVQDVEFIDATFYANAGDGAYTDASKPTLGQGEDLTLPVYKYVVPETVGTAGTLYGPDAGSRIESIVLPQRYDAEQGELTVRVDRSLAAATVDGLDWLRNYPYYCIEQIISRFLPNAVTLRALNGLGIEDPVLQAHLEVEVGYALQRLYAQQKSDGGWGWFPQDESNPLVTAYALIGLDEARQAGFNVDDRVINKATTFVEESLLTIRPQDSRWVINRQAFLLYSLARVNSGNYPRTVRLFAERENMSLYAKAYLAMTFHILDPDDERAAELLTDLNNSLIASATGAHWEEGYRDYWNWNTDTRTTTLGLMAMAQIDPDNQLIPNVVRWLMVARQADAWETTQETAWAVMALTEWMVVTGELYPDYEFNVTLNGERMALEDNTATPDNVRETETLIIEVADLLADEANRLAFIRSEGDGNMYYTAHLEAYLPVPEVEALNRGIIVARKYSLVEDPDDNPISSAEVGQPVQVEVTIIAPSNLHYVVVEDPIPAGADAVDPNLNTSSIVGTRPNLNRERPLSRGWGWWWFSNIEMRDEKVVLYATYLPRGTYQFNYVIYPGLAGEYNVIPTTAQEFYFPEVYGRGDGMLFTITGGTASETVPPPEDAVGEAVAVEEAVEEAVVEIEEAVAAEVEVHTTASGMTLAYPAGWHLVEEEIAVQIASEEALIEAEDFESGQYGILVFDPSFAELMDVDEPQALLETFNSLILSESDMAEDAEIEEVTFGEQTAFQEVIVDGNTENLMIAFDLDGTPMLAIGLAAAGELAAVEPMMMDVIASIELSE